MADLDVQPKQKKSFLPWLLLILGIIVLLFFLLRGCNNNKDGTGTADSISAAGGTTGASDAASQKANSSTQDSTPATASTGLPWGDVDFNAPNAAYEEITNKNISVRGNDNYAIYGLGENILFAEGKNSIRTDEEQNLKQIAGSINKRFKGASVRVFGYTDSVGSKGYNKELAEQRAAAVRDWLVKNGNISDANISLQPVGEAHPVASNASAQGRQQNRRVEIVVKKGQNAK